MSDLSFMKNLSSKDGKKPYVKEPHNFTFGGKPYAVATDGKFLVAVPGIGDGFPNGEEWSNAVAAVLCPHLDHEFERTIDVDFCAIFANAGKADPFVRCDTCDGEGEVNCPHCNHESDCKDCNGNGGSGGEVRYAWLCGVLVDANRLSLFLSHLTHPKALAFRGHEDRESPFSLTCAEWVLVAATLTEAGARWEEIDLGKLPVLEKSPDLATV